MDLKVSQTPFNAMENQDFLPKKEKKLRWGILKKLLKYEFRALISGYWIGMAILYALTLLLVLFLRVSLGIDMDSEFSITFEETLSAFLLITIILYGFVFFGNCLFPFVNAAHRYRKNFFKEEGYLTFSLPVTPQEHIVAKHLSGATMSLLTGVSCLISLCLVVIFSFGENFDFTLGLGGREPLEALEILQKIEQALISILSFVCVFIASGAFCCWEQKFKKRSQIFVRLLILYIAIVVLQSIFAHLGNFGLTEFLYNTVAGGHVRRWLMVFALLGANVFGFWYELHTLKHNLNVK